MKRTLPVLIGILLFFSNNAWCSEIITIYYLERVPYYYRTEDGEYKGVVLEPALRVFNQAQIPYTLVQMPAKRILSYLKSGHPNICSVGWYKTSEREQFVKYSLPIYKNSSRIAVTSKNNILMPSGKTIDEIFKIPEITLLVRDGFSYGSYIDKKISALNPKKHSSTMKNSQILKAIHRGLTNYIFMTKEEADVLIPAAGFNKTDFKYIHFSDAPAKLKRYIMFSKQVDDQIINRINHAISQDEQIQKLLNN